ncbi:U2 snRNP-associated SURP motif-containing protein [Acrasis kona]|uniref:U2 snRNP-associated SURP motif-containing protein n=1 Tax=Acrasis kona TaxID=1008807 RepID=A0AAW2YY96_9EUKA
MTSISKEKLERFERGYAGGTGKLDKEREALKAKKQMEEVEFQKIYKDFVRDFGGDDGNRYARTFVRGSTLVPSGDRLVQQEIDKEKDRVYTMNGSIPLEKDRQQVPVEQKNVNKKKDIDLLLEELKEYKDDTPLRNAPRVISNVTTPEVIVQMQSIKKLSEQEKHKIEHLIDNITLKRECIKTCMGCVLDKSFAAKYICEVIQSKILVQKDSEPERCRQLALLFLISDIIFNSSTSVVEDVHQYRTLFKDYLPAIFSHLQQTSRCDAYLREQVVKVCVTWTKWNAYDVYLIDEWRSLFE